MILRKTPHSLPRTHYGGAGKRLFIGLMLGSCVLLSLFILSLWLVPYVGLAGIHPALPWISGLLSFSLVAVVGWMCAGLVYHIYTGQHLPGMRGIRGFTVRLMFPLMELVGRLFGMSREKIRLSFVKVNNEMVLAAGLRVAPERVLLLLPHCVQRSQCPHRLSTNVERCTRCGRCPIGQLLDLRDAWGIRMAIASGGTVARRIVVQTRPAIILAVACERDLTSGILDTYPIPVFGVLNERPFGPCVDTLVHVPMLAEVLALFTQPAAGPAAGPVVGKAAEAADSAAGDIRHAQGGGA